MQFDKVLERSVGNPVFWPTYSMAKNFAVNTARIITNFWPEPTNPRTYFIYVKIFEIPYGTHVVINENNLEDQWHYQMYQNHLENVYDSETTAAMIIQKRWRVIYNKRFVAAVIIKKKLRKAIANPYTELCRRRLLREFYELGNI
jgi:hypothetical protein